MALGEGPARFARRLRGRLEVALGLETSEPHVLALLNKRSTLEDFRTAVRALHDAGCSARAFCLVKPPFLGEGEALRVAAETVDLALEAGADALSLIPTRPSSGAMERLRRDGFFSAPSPWTLHEAARYAVGRAAGRARVFADTWDLERFLRCAACAPALRRALDDLTRTQRLEPVTCPCRADWEERLLPERVRGWREFRSAYDDLPWNARRL
jgi:hypothetical protein